MTVAIVQSKTAATTAAGTISARMNGVAAQDTLLSLIASASFTEADVPTDTLANGWYRITSTLNPNGVGITVAAVNHSVAGNDTVSASTPAASELVLVELSNVAIATTRTGTQICWDASCDSAGSGSTPTCDISAVGLHGALIVALLVAEGTPTMTFNNAGWTQLGSGIFSGNTWQAQSLGTTAPLTTTISWALSTSPSWSVLVMSFPSI